ncbi:MAG: histidinol-phosphatase [Longicatena sp.]
MNQTFNYHCHTKRCGHAVGEDEEYVIEAIKNGFQKIGFSDHAPYKNGYAQGERMHDYELEGYIQSIKHLQEKYKDQIEIRIGLEFEYYDAQVEEIKEYKKRFDYLLVGEHEPSLYGPDFYKNHKDSDTLLYAQQIVKACDAQLPDYIAHPDLFMFGKEEWNEACEEASHLICKSAQEKNIPLELNLNGLQYGKCQIGKELRYVYPYRNFWLVAAQYDVKVLFGLDAHQPQKYSDTNCFEIVKNEIIYDIPLHFIKDLTFKSKL